MTFSIVIPLYNKEQSIVRTLDSVLAQTYKDYEVIIVNDGSTDHSQQVVEEYIKSHITNSESDKSPITNHQSPIRLVSKPNGGVSSARNCGIQEARGEYVAFLDGDDLWHSTYLEELAKLIADYPDKGLYAMGYKVVQFEDVHNVNTSGDWTRGIVSNPWNGRLNMWTGSSSSSSRALLLELGGFDTRMTHGEDIDMWWRLLLAKGGAQYAKPLAYYVQDSENRAMNKVIPLEKHIPYYVDKYADARAKDAAFRKFCDTQMVYRLYPYLFDKQYRKTARQLAKKLDYSQLKFTMHFRMLCPRLYKLYERFK